MEKGFTITYEYGDNLYVNPTNRCNFNCAFCLRHNQGSGGSIYTHNLWLKREPTKEEILSSIESHDLSQYKQLVFVGFGEPTYRFGRHLLGHRPDEGPRHQDLHPDGHQRHRFPHQRPGHRPGVRGPVRYGVCLPEHRHGGEVQRPVPPPAGNAYQAMKDFTREVLKYVPTVMMTVVDTIPKEEIENCRKICEEEIGATYRGAGVHCGLNKCRYEETPAGASLFPELMYGIPRTSR